LNLSSTSSFPPPLPSLPSASAKMFAMKSLTPTWVTVRTWIWTNVSMSISILPPLPPLLLLWTCCSRYSYQYKCHVSDKPVVIRNSLALISA
jgi:hypothetical protein